MKILEITDHADQKFSVSLDGIRVSMRLRYNPTTDRWSFDLSRDGNAILHGRRIVPGVDLLEAFDFGLGLIFCFSENGTEPGRNALPLGTVKLYHATQEEVDAALAT